MSNKKPPDSYRWLQKKIKFYCCFPFDGLAGFAVCGAGVGSMVEWLFITGAGLVVLLAIIFLPSSPPGVSGSLYSTTIKLGFAASAGCRFLSLPCCEGVCATGSAFATGFGASGISGNLTGGKATWGVGLSAGFFVSDCACIPIDVHKQHTVTIIDLIFFIISVLT